jgi:putative colanic acid biosynthesis UDP-glucose lipid carrier transferase
MLAGLSFFTKSGDAFSRTWFLIWMSLALLLVVMFRCSVILCLRFMRSRGLNERRVVIMGAGDLGIKLAETIQQALWTGFRVAVFMDDRAANRLSTIQGIPVIQTPEDIGHYLKKNSIDEVWLALPLRAEARMKEILHELRHHTITTRFVLDIFGLDLLNHSLTDVAGFPVLNICSSPMMGVNRLVKAVEDRIVAAIIILLISPILVPIAIAVKLSSPGPVFYRQKRVGWNGEEFEMLKFRTMPVNAEAKTGPVWATAEDQRATSIGRFLRQTSLDELPQFINVLKGEMSIVGPRPERKIFVDEFKEKIPRYMQKHLVKAGITGWAQVNGWRGNTSLEKRIEYDLYYIENWSLAFDLKIIFLTIFRGFVNRNAY